MAPPLFSVAHTPRFQTYLGPVKYSNMPPTVPALPRAGKRYVVMLAIDPRAGRTTALDRARLTGGRDERRRRGPELLDQHERDPDRPGRRAHRGRVPAVR